MKFTLVHLSAMVFAAIIILISALLGKFILFNEIVNVVVQFILWRPIQT